MLATGLTLAAVLLGTALLGVAAGFIWSAVAPRPLLIVVARGSADVVNPETSAFILADVWFTVLILIGGVISGLLGYLYAVRRYGPAAMLSVLLGALAAALIARWIGEQSGAATFHHLLIVSRPGTLLRASLELGGVGALAFWPLAAGVTAGGIEAVRYFRERRSLANQAGHRAGSRFPTASTPVPPLPFKTSEGGPAGSRLARFGADRRIAPGEVQGRPPRPGLVRLPGGTGTGASAAASRTGKRAARRPGPPGRPLGLRPRGRLTRSRSGQAAGPLPLVLAVGQS